MFNVQGKNVVIVGGLNGIGLSLTKTILTKRANKLYIIDTTENVTLIQELRTQYQTTKIEFQRIDYLNLHAGEIQNIIQNIVMKMQYIDVFVNALELFVERDLQRTMDINMKLYLNFLQLVRNVMDRNKGGRGGVIVNVLSNLGLQFLGKNEYETNYHVQQYFINKQMLLSLTKAYSDEIYFQQTGVAVMSVMPVINQKLIVKNQEWIQKIGLQNLVVDINAVRGGFSTSTLYGQEGFHGHHGHHGHQEWDSSELWGTTNTTSMYRDQDLYNQDSYDQDYLGSQDLGTQDYLNNELVYGQRLGGVTGNLRKYLDMLSYNVLRVIERGQNGIYTVVGLGGVKNIQQTGTYARL